MHCVTHLCLKDLVVVISSLWSINSHYLIDQTCCVDAFLFRSTTRTASSVRPTARTCRPAPNLTLPWCTRSPPSTPCLKGLPGPPLSLPAQVNSPVKMEIEYIYIQYQTVKHGADKNKLFSDWQITPPRPANPLTPPTPAACRPPRPHTTTEPCPSLTSGP